MTDMIGSCYCAIQVKILEVSKSMPIRDLYSKRQQRLRGEVPDVYQYDIVSSKMRNQIIHIISDISNIKNSRFATYEEINSIISREHGLLNLGYDKRLNVFEVVNAFILSVKNIDYIFDVIEVAFLFAKNKIIESYENYEVYKEIMVIDDAIFELNYRFRENGLGYQFEYPYIIRVDSKFIHGEVVKPVLFLMNDPIYTNADDEFLTAHEHYRQGRYEEAIVEANKAFESVMKVIHSKRDWDLPSPANAKKLITSLMSRGLLPASMSNYFNNLNEVLAGLPVLRNSNAGHGAGTEERKIPGYLAAYALHLAATNIVFLIETEKALG